MRTGTNHLFIPGPTNVPETVRQAMNVPMQDMRAPDFGDLTLGLFADLKRLFRTETGRVMMFPGSGTAAWEAAITNTLSPGDRVVMSRFGQFSHLWVEMAERLGLDVVCIDVPWGSGAGRSAEFFRELQRLGIKPVMFGLEYSYNWLESMPEIAACIEFFGKVSLEQAGQGAP